MTASIVFFSALGWAGLRGAFSRAAAISAPMRPPG
nr:NhaP-type Na+/H+ or K+/H+ antiporter [Nocardioides lianchengensis]